jgi:hypothetical protein
MALKITVRQSASATATVEIPEQVKAEVESLYKELSTHPGTEAHLAFDTEDERIEWVRAARSYCGTRAKGALRLRQLPSKNLPANEVRVNITNDLPANGERNGRK